MFIEKNEWTPFCRYISISTKLFDIINTASQKMNIKTNFEITDSNNTNFVYLKNEYNIEHFWLDINKDTPGKIKGINARIIKDHAWNYVSPHNRFDSFLNVTFLTYSCQYLKDEFIPLYTTLKLGVILSKLFIELDNNKLSLLCDLIAKMLRENSELDISCLKISEKPSEIYTFKGRHCFNSCMKDKHPEFFRIYDDLKFKILYLIENNTLVGRALIKEDVHVLGRKYKINLMDRVYFANSIVLAKFITWATVNGYHYKSAQSMNCHSYINPATGKTRNITVGFPVENLKGKYKRVPYIDTFAYYYENYNESNYIWSKSLRNIHNISYMKGTDGIDYRSVIVNRSDYYKPLSEIQEDVTEPTVAPEDIPNITYRSVADLLAEGDIPNRVYRNITDDTQRQELPTVNFNTQAFTQRINVGYNTNENIWARFDSNRPTIRTEDISFSRLNSLNHIEITGEFPYETPNGIQHFYATEHLNYNQVNRHIQLETFNDLMETIENNIRNRIESEIYNYMANIFRNTQQNIEITRNNNPIFVR